MNCFNPKECAERYSLGRPYFHNIAMTKIRSKIQLNEDQKLDCGLDVACGTGLSIKALKDIVENVYAVDDSEEMLKYALEIPRVVVAKSKAEDLPFNDAKFDTITVSSGIHWF